MAILLPRGTSLPDNEQCRRVRAQKWESQLPKEGLEFLHTARPEDIFILWTNKLHTHTLLLLLLLIKVFEVGFLSFILRK
jgi:hypothetical protein